MYDPSEFLCSDELENVFDGIDLIAFEIEYGGVNDDIDVDEDIPM
jgi:hypothetical protein